MSSSPTNPDGTARARSPVARTAADQGLTGDDEGRQRGPFARFRPRLQQDVGSLRLAERQRDVERVVARSAAWSEPVRVDRVRDLPQPGAGLEPRQLAFEPFADGENGVCVSKHELNLTATAPRADELVEEIYVLGDDDRPPPAPGSGKRGQRVRQQEMNVDDDLIAAIVSEPCEGPLEDQPSEREAERRSRRRDHLLRRKRAALIDKARTSHKRRRLGDQHLDVADLTKRVDLVLDKNTGEWTVGRGVPA